MPHPKIHDSYAPARNTIVCPFEDGDGHRDAGLDVDAHPHMLRHVAGNASWALRARRIWLTFSTCSAADLPALRTVRGTARSATTVRQDLIRPWQHGRRHAEDRTAAHATPPYNRVRNNLPQPGTGTECPIVRSAPHSVTWLVVTTGFPNVASRRSTIPSVRQFPHASITASASG